MRDSLNQWENNVMMRYTYDDVKEIFRMRSCELLESNYKNYTTKMQYRCICGNIDFKDLNHFMRGQRCSSCVSEKIKSAKRLSYNFVYETFLEHGYQLLELNYINSYTKMKCIHLKCGSIVYGLYGTISSGGELCKKCGNDKTALKLKHDNYYIYNYFKQYGYEVNASNYVNNETKLSYVCDRGHEGSMHFNNFKTGKRCPRCSESYGEKTIVSYLLKNNISFNREFRIADCKNKRSLPFDFAILNNDELCYLVEYDGIQHYKPTFGEKNFKIVQFNDQIKTNYCTQNNIPLLRIPYTEFNNIESILDSYFLLFKNNQTNPNQKVS